MFSKFSETQKCILLAKTFLGFIGNLSIIYRLHGLFIHVLMNLLYLLLDL